MKGKNRRKRIHETVSKFTGVIFQHYSCKMMSVEENCQIMTKNHSLVVYILVETSGFWPRVRARALRAPIFFSSLPHQTERCAPPSAHRSFAAYYSTPKINKIYWTWTAQKLAEIEWKEKIEGKEYMKLSRNLQVSFSNTIPAKWCL